MLLNKKHIKIILCIILNNLKLNNKLIFINEFKKLQAFSNFNRTTTSKKKTIFNKIKILKLHQYVV